MVMMMGVLWLLSEGFLFSKSTSSSLLKALQEQQQYGDQQQKYLLKNKTNVSYSTAVWAKSQQQVLSKNYTTHSFLGVKNPWIGKKVMSDDAQSIWWRSQKQIEKKVFPTTSFFNSGEAFAGRSFETCSYPTKTFYPEAKTQGGLDLDFKKALQQKKSPAEVRAMLEKEF